MPQNLGCCPYKMLSASVLCWTPEAIFSYWLFVLEKWVIENHRGMEGFFPAIWLRLDLLAYACSANIQEAAVGCSDSGQLEHYRETLPPKSRGKKSYTKYLLFGLYLIGWELLILFLWLSISGYILRRSVRYCSRFTTTSVSWLKMYLWDQVGFLHSFIHSSSHLFI